jgi:hypothetical protein
MLFVLYAIFILIGIFILLAYQYSLAEMPDIPDWEESGLDHRQVEPDG